MRFLSVLACILSSLLAGAYAPSSLAGETALVTGKPVRLFICAGQSNMVGRGDIAAYNKALPEARLPRPDIWSRMSDTSPGSWAPLGSGTALGPEISFALQMAKAYPDHTIAIVKIARGGTPIEYWLPGPVSAENNRDGHRRLTSTIPEALADLEALKKSGAIPSYQVSGFVWMQGETNANATREKPNDYLDRLGDLIVSIQRSTGSEQLPLVLGRISAQISPAHIRETGVLRVTQSRGGKLPEDADFVNDGKKRGPVKYLEKLERVRAAQEAFVKARPHAALVDIDDLPPRDDYHYAPSGYVAMGERFAAAMHTLLAQPGAK